MTQSVIDEELESDYCFFTVERVSRTGVSHIYTYQSATCRNSELIPFAGGGRCSTMVFSVDSNPSGLHAVDVLLLLSPVSLASWNGGCIVCFVLL